MNPLTCLDNQKLLGVRAECEVNPCQIYLDDVEGIDAKKVANLASNSTGIELMKKAIRQGFELTLEDALNTDSYKLTTNTFTQVYFQNKFKTTYQNQSAGMRGIEFEIEYPQKYQFSNLQIQNIYVRTRTTLVNAQLIISTNDKEYLITKDNRILLVESKLVNEVLSVIDEEGNEVLVASLELPTFTADETYSFTYLNFETGDFKTKIQFDQTNTAVYNTYLPTVGCCGSVTVQKSFNGLSIEGGYGVSADVAISCDSDKIKCFILPHLVYSVRFRAMMYLIQDAMLTDRMNFFAQNAQEDLEAFGKHISNQYYQSLGRKVPMLKNMLAQNDKNCFSCSSVKRGTIIY